MICPACGKVALIVEYENIELDYCPACHGVWFDAGELDILLEAAGLGDDRAFLTGLAGLSEADITEKKRPCPMCRHKMKKVNTGGDRKIITDICTRGHGIWFDGGEVSSLVKSLSEKTPHKAAANKVLGFIGEIFKY